MRVHKSGRDKKMKEKDSAPERQHSRATIPSSAGFRACDIYLTIIHVIVESLCTCCNTCRLSCPSCRNSCTVVTLFMGTLGFINLGDAGTKWRLYTVVFEEP
jgi:hypothetical protein